MLEDAVLDRYDTAIVISADSDLCPAIRSIRRVAPEKRVLVAFPPRRVSEQLRAAAHGSFQVPDSKLRKNLLPEVVQGGNGVALHRPKYWR